MTITKKMAPLKRAALLMITVCCSLAASDASAQLSLSWYSIDGGGGHSSAGAFEVDGTIGQPDAGTVMNGGTFSLQGGFWAVVANSFVLGDVNHDGIVSLLDVGPFVAAITNGTFIPEADINQDGVVSLLDVGPFVDLLTGG